MDRKKSIERNMCGDPRVFNAIQEAKRNDTSFTDKGFLGITPKYSQSQVREYWFEAMALGMRKGLEMASLEGQRIELTTHLRNPRHKEFLEQFYKLAEEYNCAIQYHPLYGMCVIDLNKKPRSD